MLDLLSRRCLFHVSRIVRCVSGLVINKLELQERGHRSNKQTIFFISIVRLQATVGVGYGDISHICPEVSTGADNKKIYNRS